MQIASHLSVDGEEKGREGGVWEPAVGDHLHNPLIFLPPTICYPG